MRLTTLIFVTLLATGVVAQPAEQATPEIRAVWVASLAPGIRQPHEVTETVDALRRANLNTMIAQIRRSGMVYFESTIEPRATTIEGPEDWDPLRQIVEECHDTSEGKQRIDVYAWFNLFNFGTQEHLFGATPAPIGETHPEWYALSRDGERTRFLDPGVPAYQEHFAALVAECLTNYEVDGVNLDYVRYPEEDSGYSPIALERFHRLTGRDDIPETDDPEWNAFRREQVASMLRRTMVTVLETRPEAMVSVCAVGFWGPPEEGQTFADTAPYRQVHQDWAGWIREGWCDIVTRMGYKREHIPEHAAHFRGWADFSRTLEEESGRPVTVGIGGYFNAPEATLNQYRVAQERGLGTTLFSYHRPQDDPGDDDPRGPESPFWDNLAAHVYTEIAPPPRPVWRADVGTVAGYVRDAEGNALDTIDVRLAGTDHVIKSDGNGFYGLLNIPPGDYTIEAPGATIDGQSVTVAKGEVVRLGE